MDSSWILSSVRIGEWNTKTNIDCSPDDESFCAPPVIDIDIAEKIVHPDYRSRSRSQHHDIALLRLASAVDNFNDFVKPICLPLDESLIKKNFSGFSLDVAGESQF